MGEWIDVRERLPKKNERVLVVCTNRQNKMQEHISICEFWGEWILWSGHKNVTHWMPLPELPHTKRKR